MTRIILFCVFALVCPAAIADQPIQKEDAAKVFEKLKKHEGLWKGSSTKGWENRLTVKVVSRGSVVMASSEFVDSPGEGMITMYYFDGDDLLLTHYCEAGNQPTLKATSVTTHGDIIFEFQGGTNLPDRNQGHMDKVVYSFVDDNHYTSQWTWYANGKESWMEKIEYERLK
jgi:hypothetical protein